MVILDSLSVSRLLTTRVFQYSDVFQVATTGDVIVTWSSVYIDNSVDMFVQHHIVDSDVDPYTGNEPNSWM